MRQSHKFLFPRQFATTLVPAALAWLTGACTGPATLREFLDGETPDYVNTCRKTALEHEVAVNDMTYLRPQLHARVWPLTLRPDSDRMVSEQVFFDALREGKLKFVLLQARGGVGKTELSKALAAEACASLPTFRVDLVELYGADANVTGANLIVDSVGKQLKVQDGGQRQSMEQLLAEGRWLLIADSLDEVPNDRRPAVIDALTEMKKRFPSVQILVLARPSVFDDRYGLTAADAVLELPPLDCGRARSSLTKVTDDKDEATRISNFAHDWKLDRQSTIENRCYFPFMSTYRDLQAVQKLAKDFATDERLTNLSTVHEAIIAERLTKELQELKWTGEQALAAVDKLVAEGGWVPSEDGKDGAWNLTMTLERCLKSQGGDTAQARNVCERLFQSVVFERIQGAREWKFGHSAVADLFVARWLEQQLAKTPGKCDALDAPSALLDQKEHKDVGLYLLSRPNGSKCLGPVTKALCATNGGPVGLSTTIARSLPVGDARLQAIASARDAEIAKTEKAEKGEKVEKSDPCVMQVLNQLRK